MSAERGAATEQYNATASYYLQDNFSGSTFFDNFVFETMNDPTNGKRTHVAKQCMCFSCYDVFGFLRLGYVDFVDKDTAFSTGLAQFRNDQVYMGVDFSNVVPDGSRGRKSIRITSNKAYNGNNLIVIDAEHMPSSAGSLPSGCSLWPAFW